MLKSLAVIIAIIIYCQTIALHYIIFGLILDEIEKLIIKIHDKKQRRKK